MNRSLSDKQTDSIPTDGTAGVLSGASAPKSSVSDQRRLHASYFAIGRWSAWPMLSPPDPDRTHGMFTRPLV
jgi:hypothetical protein